MALTFNTTIEMDNGLHVVDAYGRVGVADNIAGDSLQQIVEIFTSEAAFLDGKQSITLTDVVTTVVTPYDRNVDGTDVLAIAHTNLKALLADAGYDTTIEL